MFRMKAPPRDLLIFAPSLLEGGKLKSNNSGSEVWNSTDKDESETSVLQICGHIYL